MILDRQSQSILTMDEQLQIWIVADSFLT